MVRFDIDCGTNETAVEWQRRFTSVGNGGNPNDLNLPPKRKMLAFLNPFGGRGRAPQKWREAQEMLDFAHIDVTLKHTER